MNSFIRPTVIAAMLLVTSLSLGAPIPEAVKHATSLRAADPAVSPFSNDLTAEVLPCITSVKRSIELSDGEKSPHAGGNKLYPRVNVDNIVNIAKVVEDAEARAGSSLAAAPLELDVGTVPQEQTIRRFSRLTANPKLLVKPEPSVTGSTSSSSLPLSSSVGAKTPQGPKPRGRPRTGAEPTQQEQRATKQANNARIQQSRQAKLTSSDAEHIEWAAKHRERKHREYVQRVHRKLQLPSEAYRFFDWLPSWRGKGHRTARQAGQAAAATAGGATPETKALWRQLFDDDEDYSPRRAASPASLHTPDAFAPPPVLAPSVAGPAAELSD